MVGVVGTPAQGQLGQVAGADDEARVHQQAGAHAGLDVLEDQVVTALGGRSLSTRARDSTLWTLASMPNGRWSKAFISSRQSSRMSISRDGDAEVRHEGAALCRVRVLVPKPGMVKA